MHPERGLGKILAICMSDQHGYPTHPQEGSVRIERDGIPGDAHSGSLRESFTQPGTKKENDRPISIFSDEVRRMLNEMFDLDIQHGHLNEQIVIEGWGDLSDIEVGSCITLDGIDGEIILHVIGHAFPCTKLTDFVFRNTDANERKVAELMRFLAEKRDGVVYSKRGILCKVIQPGELVAGAAAMVYPPV